MFPFDDIITEQIGSVGMWSCTYMRICYNPNTPIVNSSPPGQNGRHFADDIFRCIFVNEKFCIFIEISLKFIPKDSIINKPALV